MYGDDYMWLLWGTFGIIGIVAVIFVFRQLVLWYFRIPEIISLLRKIAGESDEGENAADMAQYNAAIDSIKPVRQRIFRGDVA